MLRIVPKGDEDGLAARFVQNRTLSCSRQEREANVP
jgi:hypothetical protein